MDPSQVMQHIVETVSPLAMLSMLERIWEKRKMQARLKHLQDQIDKLASTRVTAVDPRMLETDEFVSLALRIVLAATQDHREIKHGMLAAALVSAAGPYATWPYEKKHLLVDLADQLEPYHIMLLERCARLAGQQPLHIHTWQEMASIPAIPEPKEDILINAIERLESASLLTHWGGGGMTRSDGGNLEYVTYLPDILKRARYARTRLADDLLAFLQWPESVQT